MTNSLRNSCRPLSTGCGPPNIDRRPARAHACADQPTQFPNPICKLPINRHRAGATRNTVWGFTIPIPQNLEPEKRSPGGGLQCGACNFRPLIRLDRNPTLRIRLSHHFISNIHNSTIFLVAITAATEAIIIVIAAANIVAAAAG